MNGLFFIVINTLDGEIIFSSNIKDVCDDHINDAITDNIDGSNYWAAKEAHYVNVVKPGFRRVVADFNEDAFAGLERLTAKTGKSQGEILCKALGALELILNPSLTEQKAAEWVERSK